MKIKIFLVVMLMLCVGRPAFAEFKSEPCLIMPKKMTKEKRSAVYNGKTYYFCCKTCVKRFKKDPQKYLTQQPISQAGAATAPTQQSS